MSLRVLFSGEAPVGSAPTLELGRAISRVGGVPIFGRGIWSGGLLAWISAILHSDVVVFVEYNGPTDYAIRQYSVATLLGRPLVRWWVGSDVLYALENDRAARMSNVLDKLVLANTTSALHLVSELKTVGINARYIISTVDSAHIQMNCSFNLKTVLIYMPAARKEFYGFSVVEKLIRSNSDLTFIIVGDDTHALARYSNVKSIGWVDDMHTLYEEIGCLIRLTRHDGVPRMVLEALLRGKYVIHSWPLPGCWLARTYDEADAALQRYRLCQGMNEEGRSAVHNMLKSDPAGQYLDLLDGLRKSVTLPLRAKALSMAFQYGMRSVMARVLTGRGAMLPKGRNHSGKNF